MEFTKMDKRPHTFLRLTGIAILAMIPAGITMLLQGEAGWLKLLSWMIFYMGILYASTSEKDWSCPLFKRWRGRGS
jgi:hypothetical protein